jgi:hypothetical protein
MGAAVPCPYAVQIQMPPRLKFALLCLVALSLCILLALTVAGIQSRNGRFVPVTDNLALDSRTGRLCWSYDPLGPANERIPLCSDLAGK